MIPQSFFIAMPHCLASKYTEVHGQGVLFIGDDNWQVVQLLTLYVNLLLRYSPNAA